MTAIDLITKQDLADFKRELLADIKVLVTPDNQTAKKWVRSIEVRKMLKISPGTLQNLRVNGTLRFTKIGGIMFYKAEDIAKMMEDSI